MFFGRKNICARGVRGSAILQTGRIGKFTKSACRPDSAVCFDSRVRRGGGGLGRKTFGWWVLLEIQKGQKKAPKSAAIGVGEGNLTRPIQWPQNNRAGRAGETFAVSPATMDGQKGQFAGRRWWVSANIRNWAAGRKKEPTSGRKRTVLGSWCQGGGTFERKQTGLGTKSSNRQPFGRKRRARHHLGGREGGNLPDGASVSGNLNGAISLHVVRMGGPFRKEACAQSSRGAFHGPVRGNSTRLCPGEIESTAIPKARAKDGDRIFSPIIPG